MKHLSIELSQELDKYNIEADSLDEAQTVIRNKYKIHIEIRVVVLRDSNEAFYYYTLRNISKYDSFETNLGYFDNYEQCLEAGLIDSLKLIKDETSEAQ